MVRRSHRRRKRFSCGHQGFGRSCHRCIQVANPVQPPSPDPLQSTSDTAVPPQSRRHRKTTSQLTAKWQWQQTFAHDPIDLTHLPKPIALKTRRILQSLNQGMSPAQLQGRRFSFDRTLLRIPISYRYRLLCRWYSNQIVPLQVLTHEAYNPIAHHKKRMTGS